MYTYTILFEKISNFILFSFGNAPLINFNVQRIQSTFILLKVISAAVEFFEIFDQFNSSLLTELVIKFCNLVQCLYTVLYMLKISFLCIYTRLRSQHLFFLVLIIYSFTVAYFSVAQMCENRLNKVIPFLDILTHNILLEYNVLLKITKWEEICLE